MKKRILSLFLALVMILGLFPANIFAVPENVLSQENDYSYYVGGTAKFNPALNDIHWQSVSISDDPSRGWSGSSAAILTENYMDLMMVIDEVYNGNDSDGLWVKVSAAVGHTLPDDLVSYPWIYQNDWNSSSYPDSLIITPPVANQGYLTVSDGSGNIVTGEFTLPMYEKPTLTANSSLAQITSDVEYQWQIEYEEGKWVDIYGETGRTLKLSYGMVATLLNDDGEVDVRCASFAGAMTAYGEPITVTIEMYQPEEPDVVVSESFTTSSGNTVTVTVAGSLPEDSSVALLETDASGVDVAEGETVVAALDISIKNADGTEWQPESGETVTVTLGASSIGLENGDEFVVYHLHNGVVKLLGSFVVADNTVSFEVDGFSKFVFALASSNEIETPDFSGDIGKYAHLTYSDEIFVQVTPDDPESDYREDYVYDLTDFSTDFTVSIEDYRVVTEISEISSIADSEVIGYAYRQALWYQVNVVKGTCTYEDFTDGCWILQNYITEGDAYDNDTLTLFDPPTDPEDPDDPDEPVVPDEPEEPAEPSCGLTVNGVVVENITVTEKQSVTINAEATFSTADISYQWQICYDTANDLWVDIHGQTAKDLTVTAGMIVSLIDENNQVLVRCTAKAGSSTVVSEPITISLPSGGTDSEAAEVAITVDGEDTDSVYINESDKATYSSVYTATTNLTGTLTYQWDVLFRPETGIWKTIATSETIVPTFDRNVAGTYIGNSNYSQYVDDTTSSITFRLTVSDGINAVSDTFTLYIKSETVNSAMFSTPRAKAISYPSPDSDAAPVDDAPTTYNVIIKYNNADGSAPVADPYVSTVSPTTVLNNTISFPKIVGYVPKIYKDGNWVEQDAYEFVDALFTEDFTLEVRYFPGEVNYTVNVYIQNAENDEYALLDSITELKAETGTVLDEKDLEFVISGYYQSKFTTTSAGIAADGSTVFNLYYDRIYYLMKFDLDGGYGVYPVYARHGVKLDISSPTKAGYTFVGWDNITNGTGDEIADTLPATMPIGNTAYKAIWKAADNAKVTIVYWGENPNDEGYSYLESQELYVKPGTTLNFGNDQLVCTLEEHTHGKDCTYKCGIAPHTHEIDAGCYTLNCSLNSHSHADSGCTLKCQHGQHELSCYSVDGRYDEWFYLKETSKPNTTLTYNGDGIYTYVTNRQTHYYLYLDGKWYCAGTDWFDQATISISLSCNHGGHTNVCYSCGLNEGTHVHSIEQNCYTVTCTTTAHTHSADCYSCIAHTHNDDCYLKTTNQDSTLWKYVRSDTVTVAADGSTVMNVYYDRTTFTITFRSANSSSSSTPLGTITDKWGADIRSRFEAECKEHTFLWSQKSSGDSPWTSFLDVMPQENRTYYAKTSSGSTQTAVYYGADLNGEYTITLYTSAVKSTGTLKVSEEEFIEIEGFVFNASKSTKTESNFNGAKFYYDRAKYLLEFNNGEGIVESENVFYEANLESYQFVPEAPSKYETGSVEFAGWYLNPECTGDEVVLSETTMPASNIILYAKWTPVKHNVTVYRYKDANGTLHDMLCNHTDEDIGDFEGMGAIPHGTLLNKHYIPEEPTNGNYTFVTWAYYDKDLRKEVSIDINNYVVTKDVEIYAIWSSNVQIPYTIMYMIEGTKTAVAAAETGKHYAGETHTFNAKTGGNLYADFQTGYFPTIPSHSIDFKEEDDSYEYTFYYVKKDSVPYTVYYVTEQQNSNNSLTPITLTEEDEQKTYYIVAETKTTTTTNAIVTENFKTVSGYMPDAYQKTLIINGTDNAVNQIIFKYNVDITHAYYKVTHYTEQIDGSWYPHSTYESIGDINRRYTEAPMTINGFTYSEIKYLVNGEVITTGITDEGAVLTEDGLEINLYYTRNKYPYTVEYRLYDNDTLLYSVPDLEDQYYGATVSHTAPKYWGDGNVYERVSAETLTTTIQTDATKNLITFYYDEREVTIRYEVSAPGGGTVNPSQETVLIASGTAQGSTADALPGYKFVGWYDATGKQLSTANKFVPNKVDGLNVAATYYAKFEEAEVTINYVVAGPTGSGTVALNKTAVFGTQVSEKITAVTGTLGGAAASAKPGYEFKGWFKDATCTTPVDSNWLQETNKIIPTKTNNELWVDGTTYYAKFEEADVTINYVVVGPTGSGTVTVDSETVKAVTEDPNGSTAAASSNLYKFVGWYSDEACENFISSNADFTPAKVNGLNVAATYYAKFEYNLTSLTIKKDGWSEQDENQTFIFNVKGNGVDLDVTVHGNGSVTIEGLTVGETYTVTEKTDWSWRYALESISPDNITLGADATKNLVTVKNSRSFNFWLDGNSWCNNIFKSEGDAE